MLINCPECGSQVSDKAKICTHCGYSLEDARNERAAEEAAIIAQRNQAAYDATFIPNDLYLAAPMPFKIFFRPFTARGRATRAEYWLGLLVLIVLSILLASVIPFENPLLWIWIVYSAFVICNASIRRIHDAGVTDEFSGIVAIVSLIPVFGWGFYLFVHGAALFSPSDEGSNENGPNPEVFYNMNTRQTILDPQEEQTVSQQMGSELSVEQRNVIVFNCPYCGGECESEEEIQVRQHVICPYCGEKFLFGG